MGKNDSYRILKLRSGEQLITAIKGQSGNKYVLERPMIFKTMSVYDAFGHQKEVTVLKDWLSFTNEIQTKIPKDHVASFLTPAEEAIDLYEIEKEKQDVFPTPTKINKYNMNPDKSSDPRLEEELKMIELFNKLNKNLKDGSQEPVNLNDENLEEGFDPLQDFDSEEEKEEGMMKNFVSMTLFFPPEVLLTLVEDGIVDKMDVLELMNYLKGKNTPYTGNEKDNPNFGNRWTDWPVDLDDYFNDDEEE